MPPNDSKERQTQDLVADYFKAIARRLECDENKKRFEAKLKKIAKAKPKK